MYKKLQVAERKAKGIDFNPDPKRLKVNYPDVFEGVKSDILYITKYNEDCDIGTIYMSRSSMMRKMTLKQNTELQNYLDTGASKTFMFDKFYLRCSSLHSLTNLLQNVRIYWLEMFNMSVCCL